VAEWSEKPNSETLEEDIEEVDLVIIGSRICSDMCLGSVMCCFRSKVARSVKNEVAYVSPGSSRWRLKSPKVMNSEGYEANSSRREGKSDIKEALECEGGR